MEKELERKLKKKRMRKIAIIVIGIIAIIAVILKLNFDYSDYGKQILKVAEKGYSLSKQVQVGNEENQYAKYTVQVFCQKIDNAKAVAEDDNLTFDEKKNAYKELKSALSDFEKDVNNNVLDKSQVEELVAEDSSKTRVENLDDNKELEFHINGNNIKNAKTINFKASLEGPYYGALEEYMAEHSLQGQIISLYQMGSYGGELSVKLPMYTDNYKEAFLYRYDIGSSCLKYSGKVELAKDSAKFYVSEGGDYVVLSEKVSKTAKVDNKTKSDDSKAAETNESNLPTKHDTAADKIQVTVTIRCDTLSNDMSQLTNDSVKDYIPSDGFILSKTKVSVGKNSTAYDALCNICKSKKIQYEAKYTPSYGSYYIEGISYLYELDAGPNSGWMFKINDSFPEYGPSEIKLKDGDNIVFCYTCDLGEDVGDTR